MALPDRMDPKSPDDWIVIAKRELDNLRRSYSAGISNDSRIDHALRATEAVLKAILWKHHKWAAWPKKTKGYKFLYGHALEEMLTQCHHGLRTSLRLSPAHWPSWQTVANISLKHSRYSATVPSDVETNVIAKCVRHPDTGVVPWLLKHYTEMP